MHAICLRVEKERKIDRTTTKCNNNKGEGNREYSRRGNITKITITIILDREKENQIYNYIKEEKYKNTLEKIERRNNRKMK